MVTTAIPFFANRAAKRKNIRRARKRKPRRDNGWLNGWTEMGRPGSRNCPPILVKSFHRNPHSPLATDSHPVAPVVLFLPYGPVLPIFWTLPNVRPMSIDRRETVLHCRTGGPVPAAGPFVWLSGLAWLTVRGTPERKQKTMKNAWLILLAVFLAVGLTGCAHHGMYGGCMTGSCATAPGTCAPCGIGGACPGGYPGPCLGGNGPCVMGGAPLTAMQYPYYTTRGPRDFLVSEPKPLGP